MFRRSFLRVLLAGVLIFPAGGFVPTEARTRLKPGFNMISRQQEVQLGRQAAVEVERQMPVSNDARVTAIGRRLARVSPAPDYPYTFKVVRDQRLNAFALPGGPVYVNAGTIRAAENESQLAGVIAHEIAHVALRHASNQASKAMLAQAPLSILGGLIGSGSAGAQVAQIALGMGANGVMLKYSRDAERQADLAAVHMLHDAGYNPNELARFFDKMARSGGRSVEWLSSHPNPGNRGQLIRREIASLR